jgi:oxygen-dependent protoporphyrinogen oxidase
MRVVVVGGGISGLAVAFEILERSERVPGGVEVVCLEAATRPGGNIQTDREDGYTCEWGPNGFLDNVPATLDLVRRLGMERRLLPSDAAAAKRFLFRKGRLRQLPSGAAAFLTSDVLSWPGKLRVLLEPFQPGPKAGQDESVLEFAARRIGREAATVLVDAMVSGIYAGNAANLSLRATFPKMWAMEAEHGSLTRAMLARRGARSGAGGGPAGPGGRLTSFLDGLQELTDGLALALGPALRLESPVEAISDMGVRGFRVHLREGAPIDAAAVVLACPSWAASGMVAATDRELARLLDAIPSAALAVVHLGFDAAEIGGKPDGFGFLIPRGEAPRILGTLWSSSIFGFRAPEGRALLTCMVGGAHDPEAVTLSDAALVDLVRRDLGLTMAVTATPKFVKVFRHPRGIPQYSIGHPDRIDAIGRRLEAHPGLLIAGNSYRGISVNACAEEAPRVAESALAFVTTRVTAAP